ncbi:MAG: hypothetical protein DHS80DRAFT_22513 [Piptocephalis tieghemiana]|nr:MAG: hypothetical protein DHS80DRAFT_22513 [Piptocephalis tieghemiana]
MDMDLALEMQHEAERALENESQAARYRRHRRTRSAFFIEQEERGGEGKRPSEKGRRRRASQRSRSGGSLSLSPEDLPTREEGERAEGGNEEEEGEEEGEIEAAFSLPDFLSTRTHLPLDALHGELRDALKEIRGRRVDVLSVEYGAFIGLGKDLHGLDRDIQEMRTALLQMSREIQGTEGALDTSISRLYQALQDDSTRYHTIQADRRIKHARHLLQDLQVLLDAGTLDQAGSEKVMRLLESLALLGPLSDVEVDERARGALVEYIDQSLPSDPSSSSLPDHLSSIIKLLSQGDEGDEGMDQAKTWLLQYQESMSTEHS